LTDSEYDQWERKWFEWWTLVTPPSGWLAPLFKNEFGDGSKIRDGNPIFSAYSSNKLFFRVIQQEYENSFVNFWPDDFAKGELEELNGICVVCSFHDSSVSQARQLIEEWIKGNDRSLAT
jgi:hypothetical protein